MNSNMSIFFKIVGLAAVLLSFTFCKVYVPDEKTAILIAEAIWLPIYGEDLIENKPFRGTLENDSIWHVFGSLPSPKISIDINGDSLITIVQAGVPEIWISKFDARVLKVTHGK